jgi:hypothetical protein
MSLEERSIASENEELSDNDSDFSVTEMKRSRRKRAKR